MKRLELGRKGEKKALEYLTGLGMKMLVTNWHCAHKEIDIIMEDTLFLHIIEVRTLKFPNQISPVLTINKRKRNLIISAAGTFAKLNKIHKEIVFDIVAITYNGEEYKLEYFPNAFQPKW